MGHAERLAEALHARYRHKTMVACQHVVAALLGHDDWPSLQAAVAGGAPASRADDEVPVDVARARRHHQLDVACRLLAGLDDEAQREAARLDRELLSGPPTLSQRHDPHYNEKRLRRARYAFERLHAEWTVDEIAPTGRAVAIPEDDAEIDLIWRVELLPQTLRAWLEHHRPQFERWAGMIAQLRVRQRCLTELLAFAHAWGEFTIAHGVDIPRGLQVYPIALCARWYAWQRCARDSALQIVGHGMPTNRDAAALHAAIREAEEYFLLGQPREDFRALSPSAREQQMRAGHTAVRRCMLDTAARHGLRPAPRTWLTIAPLAAAR